MNEYTLMLYYRKYLKEIRKVSESTVKHYEGALKYISRYMIQRHKLQETIYEIQDIEKLETIREFLYNDPDFVEMDRRNHQMYSAWFNNYFNFANGIGFSNICQEIFKMDMEVPAPMQQNKRSEIWKRSSIIKIQTIEAAGYKCEINSEHTTFTAKSTGHPYMEGHHVVPLKFQNKFSKNLDIYANVVCLCPVCHRLLHYGVEREKQIAVDKIYYERADRLAASGIRMDKNDLKKMIC